MVNISVCRGISFFFQISALLLVILSHISAKWVVFENFYYGLWAACFNSEILDYEECDFIDDDAEAMFWAARACHGFAAVLGVVALILYSVWMCRKESYLRRYGAGPVGIAALVLTLISGLSSMSAVALFIAEYADVDTNIFGWGFMVATTAAGLNILNGLVTLCVVSCCFHADVSDTQEPLRRGAQVAVITTTTTNDTNGLYPNLNGLSYPMTETTVYTTPPPATAWQVKSEPTAPHAEFAYNNHAF